MLCKYVKQKLDRYVHGDLSERDSKEIKRHLSKCQVCSDALYRLKTLAGLFEDTSLPPVPAGFSERLMQRARRQQYLQRSSEPVVIRLWEWLDRTGLKKSAAAAVLVLGLAIGVLMGRDTWKSPGIQSVGKSQMAQVEPSDIYNLDYLTDSPKGSLSDVYLTLVSGTNGEF